MDAKEEIRSRLSIEDVIGEYVPLKRAGRSFKGLSPFSQEKTPSFFVSPDKQIWHDFSSNRGGDVFSFVMEVEGLDFRQAMELLARKAGVDLSLYQTAGNQSLTKKKQRLLSLLDAAATYYQRVLYKSPGAIDYVSKKRQLNRDIVHSFRIGYAPDAPDQLQQFLLNKQFTKTEIREAGLIGSSGRYDMFRDRIMVPLMDGAGQVIGFTARLLGGDDQKAPKYINTPQTLVYDKSRHVFGLSQAKEAIRTNDYAVIVEGNLDVISAHQAGTRQVVATAGTALTESHLKALSRLTHNLRLCFDGDKAGVAATERAVPIAQAVGVELSIVSLPSDYKDPDEAIKADPAIWTQAIGKPEPAIDWLLRQYQQRYDLTTASGKRQLSNEAMAVIRGLSDSVEQEHYLQKLSRITGASLEALKQKQVAGPGQIKRFKPLPAAPAKAERDPQVHQDYLLGLALYDPSVHETLKRLEPADLSGEARQTVLGYLLEHLGAGLGRKLPDELHQFETYVKIVMFKAETRYEAIDANERLIEAASLVRRVQEEKATQKKLLLDRALQDAEARHDDGQARQLRVELAKLIKEKKRAR